MPAYAEFAGFYDQIMGDRSLDVARVRNCVTRFHPAARSLLELGCGTGAMLAGLAPGLAVTGVDRSAEMLAIAARNAPSARLVEADMTAFSLQARFDVVISVFDTLNHLPRLEGWRAMFDRVHEHLADGGLFFFDVNTTGRLRRLWQGPPFAADFGEHTMIMDVRPAERPEGDGGAELSMWTVRIFERVGGDAFRLHEEHIPELGVPLATIRDDLAPRFDLLDATGLDGEAATDASARAFFAYRKRPGDGIAPSEGARLRDRHVLSTGRPPSASSVQGGEPGLIAPAVAQPASPARPGDTGAELPCADFSSREPPGWGC